MDSMEQRLRREMVTTWGSSHKFLAIGIRNVAHLERGPHH